MANPSARDGRFDEGRSDDEDGVSVSVEVARGVSAPGEPERIPGGDASESLRVNVDAPVVVSAFALTCAPLSRAASRGVARPTPNPNPARVLDAPGSRSFAIVSPVSARHT